eukprot:g5799.t1
MEFVNSAKGAAFVLVLSALASGHGAPSGTSVPPHLASLFTTVSGEMDNVTAPVVKGAIPEWVSVTKIQNGFGKFEGDSGFAFTYLFDVMSYVAKWRVSAGKVSFSNRFIESQYLGISKTKTPAFRTFGGVTPSMGPMDVAKALVHLTSDNYNVNIQLYGRHLFAISDMAGQMEMDADDLSTRGLYKFNDSLTQTTSMITCAHPTQLHGDRYLYNYLVSVMGNFPHVKAMSKYQIFRIDTSVPEGTPLRREVVLELPIPSGEIPYMHQFANTPNYLVLMQFPLHWSIPGIIGSTRILPNMHWHTNNGTKLIVIDKAKRAVVKELWYKEPVFAYHYINYFEDDAGDVVLDISLVPCGGSAGPAECKHMNSFQLSTLRNQSFTIPHGTATRFHVPVASPGTEVTATVQTNTSFDLIGLNPRSWGRPYRFAWGTGDHGEGVWWNSLVKVDMDTGATLEWYKEDHFPAEPKFIPRPGATAEDDGVLLSTVLGGDRNASYLLVLNASTMAPIAEANAPHFLPYLSHGTAMIDGF